jgi:IS30 family transposase
MDEKIRDILNNLQEPTPRSCLDPLRELIDELHRRGRTYREIARILAERCEVSVSVSTVFRYLHNRSRTKPQACKLHFRQVPKSSKLAQPIVTEEEKGRKSIKPELASDEIQKRIAALKIRPELAKTASQLFQYDPDEPLHLPQKTRENKSDE